MVPGRSAAAQAPAQTPAQEIAEALRGGGPAAGKAAAPPAAGRPAAQAPFPAAPGRAETNGRQPEAPQAAGLAAAGDRAAPSGPAAGHPGTAAARAVAGGQAAGKVNLAVRVRKEGIIRPRGLGAGAAAVWIVILVVILLGAAIFGSVAFLGLGGAKTSLVPAGRSSDPTQPGPRDGRSSAASRTRAKGFIGNPPATSPTGTYAEIDDGGQPAATVAATAKGPGAKGATTPRAPDPVVPVAGTNPGGIQITDMKSFSGFKGGTATYVGCRLKNGTGKDIPVLKLTTVGSEGGKDVGTAEAIIYNIPAGATIPLVAEWGPHDEGARATSWSAATTEVNPAGVPQDLPKLVASKAWAFWDPNVMSTVGKIKTTVINQGMMTVPAPEAFAILLGEDGTIVGVAKGVVPKELKPGEATEIMLPWERTLGSKVKSAEIWVQPAR